MNAVNKNSEENSRENVGKRERNRNDSVLKSNKKCETLKVIRGTCKIIFRANDSMLYIYKKKYK